MRETAPAFLLINDPKTERLLHKIAGLDVVTVMSHLSTFLLYAVCTGNTWSELSASAADLRRQACLKEQRFDPYCARRCQRRPENQNTRPDMVHPPM